MVCVENKDNLLHFYCKVCEDFAGSSDWMVGYKADIAVDVGSAGIKRRGKDVGSENGYVF